MARTAEDTSNPAFDPLEFLREQRRLAALAALVRDPTEEEYRSAPVAMESVYEPRIFARSGPQESFDVFQPDRQPSPAPDYLADYRRGERAIPKAAPVDATPAWARGPIGGTRNPNVRPESDYSNPRDPFGPAAAVRQKGAEALEGAQQFAQAGSAMAALSRQPALRTRFESLVQQIAQQTGRDANDPSVRFAAGVKLQEERPDDWKILGIGEKGLTELAFDPFNAVGGVGVESALLRGGARVAEGAGKAASKTAAWASESAKAPFRPLRNPGPTPLNEAGVADELVRGGMERGLATETARRSANPPLNFLTDEGGMARLDLGLTGRGKKKAAAIDALEQAPAKVSTKGSRRKPIEVQEHHLKNVLAMYDQADGATLSAGRTWYKNFSDEVQSIAEAAGIFPQRVAAAAAVLSRQTRWSRNRAALYEHIRAQLDGAPEPPRTGTLYASNDQLAFAILSGRQAYPLYQGKQLTWVITDEPFTGASGLDRLGKPGSPSGKKSRAFAGNALRGTKPVMDTIATQIAEGLPARVKPEKATGGRYYEELEAAYNAAAVQRGESPEAMQAVTWIQQHGGAKAGDDFAVEGATRAGPVTIHLSDYRLQGMRPGVVEAEVRRAMPELERIASATGLENGATEVGIGGWRGAAGALEREHDLVVSLDAATMEQARYFAAASGESFLRQSDNLPQEAVMAVSRHEAGADSVIDVTLDAASTAQLQILEEAVTKFSPNGWRVSFSADGESRGVLVAMPGVNRLAAEAKMAELEDILTRHGVTATGYTASPADVEFIERGSYAGIQDAFHAKYPEGPPVPLRRAQGVDAGGPGASGRGQVNAQGSPGSGGGSRRPGVLQQEEVGAAAFLSDDAGAARLDLAIPDLARAAGRFLREDAGAQFGPAAPKAGIGDIGVALQRGIKNKQARMERIVQKVQRGEKIGAAQAEELRDFLKDVDPAQALEYDRIFTPVVLAQRAEDTARATAKLPSLGDRVAKAQDTALGKELRAVERDIADAKQRLGRDEAGLVKADVSAEAAANLLEARRMAAEMRVTQQGADAGARIDQRLAAGSAEATIPPAARVGGDATERTQTFMSREDAARFSDEGLLSPRDAEVLSRSGLNVSKLDPEEARFMARTVRDNPAAFPEHKTVGHSDLIHDSARYHGMTYEEMEKEIVRRGMAEGEASAFLFAANATVVRLGAETRDLAARLGDGTVTQAAVDDAYAKYISFAARVGGADSEAGRMLNSLKITRPTALVSAVQQNRIITANRRHVADLTKQLEKQQEVLAALQREADTARAAAEQITDTRLQKIAADHAVKMDAQAKAAGDRIGKLQAQIDTTQAALVKAVTRKAELGEELRLNAIKRALKAGTDPEAVKALALLDPSETVKIAEAMRSLHKLSSGEKVVAFMSNNLYSSIHALEANAIGGALRVAEKLVLTTVAERTTAPLLAKVTGEAVSIEKGAAQDMMAAIINSAPGAAHAMSDTILKGLDETGARLADVKKGRPFPGKKGLFLEWALRTNGSADAGARHLANHMEGFALARREAMRELRSGTITKDEVADRMAFYRINPTDQMLKEQGDRAMEISYGGRLGGFGEKVQGVIGHAFDLPGLGPTPALRLLFAASRFTWSATALSVEASGGGLIRMITLASKGPDFHSQAAIAGARGSVGGLLMAGGFGLYSQGLLMGRDPEGRGRDDSVLINGEWRPLKWAWPLTGGLIYAARVGDAEKEGRLTDGANILNYVQFGAKGMADAITSHPVVRTTAGLYDAIRKGGETGERFFANLIASRGIPNASAIRDITRMVDSIERDPKTYWDYLTQNTPLASDIAPKIDPYTGAPIERAVQGWERLNPAADPERPYTSPVAAEYARHKELDDTFSALTLPGDTFKVNGLDIGLDRDEHTKYAKFVGQSRNEILGAILASPDYQSATPKDQRRMLNAGETKAVNAGRKALGLDLAFTATDPKKVAQGVSIAVGSGSAYSRAVALGDIDKAGKLTPEVIAEVDRRRGPITPASSPEIIDGDTVEVTMDGARVKVRLVGINTAETDKGGALDAFLAGKDLEVMSIKTDRYGRTVGELYADGESASDALERNGKAIRTYYEQGAEDLRVADLKEGKRLREVYDAAPAFRPLRMEQIAAARVTPQEIEAAAATYKKLIASYQDKNIKTPWNTVTELKNLYRDAAGGFLRSLYTIDGDLKKSELSDARKAIAGDGAKVSPHPLWDKFRP